MTSFVHICPVCQRHHEVPAPLHQLAYRRQLTCSPHCKATLPTVLMARLSMPERPRAEAGFRPSGLDTFLMPPPAISIPI